MSDPCIGHIAFVISANSLRGIRHVPAVGTHHSSLNRRKLCASTPTNSPKAICRYAGLAAGTLASAARSRKERSAATSLGAFREKSVHRKIRLFDETNENHLGLFWGRFEAVDNSERSDTPLGPAVLAQTAGLRCQVVEPVKTILVVEDNELNMRLLHDLLASRGYAVLQTGDATEALTLARQHKPDLILMDISLPGVSGLEVIKWIKNDGALNDIPIIAVTAFAMKGDKEKICQSGCDGYIAKPISVANFLKTVEQFLG